MEIKIFKLHNSGAKLRERNRIHICFIFLIDLYIDNEFFFVFQESLRRQPAESLKVSDGMRLVGKSVEITQLGEVCYIAILQQAVCFIQPVQAHILFRADAHFVFKLALQLPGTDKHIFSEFFHLYFFICYQYSHSFKISKVEYTNQNIIKLISRVNCLTLMKAIIVMII